jgi:O-methyltransferase involved in polyketide biosynthesis
VADDPSLYLAGQEPPPPGVDITVAHSPRIWNYWLGGKDNYAVDRQVGDQFREIFPDIIDAARASRGFLIRSIRYLAGEAGIRQFLDIGTGLPTGDNTHQVAQRIAPESHVVYVDNDPLVLAHARALLISTPEGATNYIDADLREPDKILQAAARMLDFTQPIALILSGILGHITDDEAYAIVDRLLDALPPGSYLSLSDGTNVIRGEAFEEAIRFWNSAGSAKYCLRSPEQLARFFDSLELVEPGVVSCPLWRPEPNAIGALREVDQFGGVGKKASVS